MKFNVMRSRGMSWATAMVVALAAPCVLATDWVWDGGPTGTGTDWNTDENWDQDTLPGSGAGDTTTIALDGANVTMSADDTVRTLTVSGNGATAPTLNITQDLGIYYTPFEIGSHASGTGYGGVVNHTAGTVLLGGSGTMRLKIAASASAATSGNSGTYNFGGEEATAPVLDVGEQIAIGGRDGEVGVLSMSGYGSLLTGANVNLSIFNNTSGSSIEITGGNLDINIGGDLEICRYGGGYGTLKATIDETGFSTIHVTNNVALDNGGGGANVLFDLHVDPELRIPVGTTYTIIDAGAPFTDNEEFANAGDGTYLTNTVPRGDFVFRCDYENTTDFTFKLVATEVPPPQGTVVSVK
jgi:hypothetical protein